MKSGTKLLKGVGLAVILVSALGMQSAMAVPGTIATSAHDFSTTGPSATYKSATQTQICIYCHAPHNNNNVAGTLLWNRALVGTATYTMYTNPSTMQSTAGTPGVVSKLCLSCHDGTIAIDSFGGATGTKMATGTVNLGGVLTNDHPIGFVYNTALATSDGGLKNPTVGTATVGYLTAATTGTIEAKLLFGTAGAKTMECASCHDVHNSAGGTAVQSKLVRVTTAGSALCVTCHVK